MRVALTGHRPQRLGLPEDETDEKWIPIQHWIIDELSNFIKTCRDNNEPLDLYTGMASRKRYCICYYRSINELYK